MSAPLSIAAFLARKRDDSAAEAFACAGLPGPREEAWRYTRLAPLADITFAEPGKGATVTDLLPEFAAPRLVFVAGRFAPELSATPGGALAINTGAPAPLGAPLAELAAVDRLATLNAMLAVDGAAIEVDAGHDGGVLMLASLADVAAPSSFHPRHAITLGAGARLVLVEVARGRGAYLANSFMSVTVGEGATLLHVRLHEDSAESFTLGSVHATVAAGGTYDSFLLAAGGRLARSEMHVRLAGPGATAHLNAAQMAGGSRHTDFTTRVVHDAPATISRQTVRNVLTGRARGVFQGRIEVSRVAQRTDGYQMNQTLLLSPTAEIDCKPQLEIYADDVKCSHGATIGALDPEQMFYLRSRGIAEREARNMLVRAFLGGAVEGVVHEAARALVAGRIDAWWEGEGA